MIIRINAVKKSILFSLNQSDQSEDTSEERHSRAVLRVASGGDSGRRGGTGGRLRGGDKGRDGDQRLGRVESAALGHHVGRILRDGRCLTDRDLDGGFHVCGQGDGIDLLVGWKRQG